MQALLPDDFVSSLLGRLDPRMRVLRDEPDRVILEIPVAATRVLIQVTRKAARLEATALLGWPARALRETARQYRARGMRALVNHGCCFLRVAVGTSASVLAQVGALAAAAAEIVRACDVTPLVCDVFAHFRD